MDMVGAICMVGCVITCAHIINKIVNETVARWKYVNSAILEG